METLNLLASWAQIISLPIAIVAILVSIWLYYRSKQRRAIACIFDQIEFPIEIKAGEALDGSIEILYKGKTVKNIFIVRVRIKNTGNISIRNSNIIDPLTFRFESTIVILREPRVIEQKPSNLNIEWRIKNPKKGSKEITFLFDLLNPGDEVVAEFLCTGNVVLPDVIARIDGVNDIESLDLEEKKLKGVVRDGLVIVAMAVIFVSLQYSSLLSRIKVSETIGVMIAWLVIIFVVFLYVLMLWGLILRPIFNLIKYRRKKETNKSNS